MASATSGGGVGMVAEPRIAVDVDGAVRQWCRDQGFVTFFGTNNSGTFPQVVIETRIGPDDECLIQFDVWSAERSKGGSRKEAQDESARLATALDALTTYIWENVRLLGAVVSNRQWLPDPVSDTPRYIVEATVTATSL